MAKRILVVSQHYWPETFRITDICEAFVQKGIEVDVLCGLPNYPKGEFFEGYGWNGPTEELHNGVHIYRAKEVRRKGNTSLRIFLNYISFPFFARLRIRKLLKNHYDAIFSYETSPVFMAYPALWFSKKSNTPCTIYVLDLWPENLYSVMNIQNKFLRKVIAKLSLWHYNRADRLIAMSPALQSLLIERTKKNSHAVAVIPQYSEDFYTLRPTPTDEIRSFFRQHTFTILFAGNISPAQSLETLVYAAAKVEKSTPGAVQYVIVGDGMSFSEIEKLCETCQIAHLFRFAGQRPATDLPSFQVLADALFVGLKKSPMLGLTIPAKIASYCAAGKPILASMDGEGANVIENASCGLTSPAENIDKLAIHIHALANSTKEQLAQMGANGFLYYQTHFQRDTILQQLENFILN